MGVVGLLRCARDGYMLRTTWAGMKRTGGGGAVGAGRVRRCGAGRAGVDECLIRGWWAELERLVEPETRGDPVLAAAVDLEERWASWRRRWVGAGPRGRQTGRSARCCEALGYSLQGNHKTREGGTQADRDAQFAHINETARAALEAGEPVISVDAKKQRAGGGFQDGRAGSGSRRGTPVRGPHPRLQGQGSWAGDPLRRLRLNANEGWVSGRHRRTTPRSSRSTTIRAGGSTWASTLPEATTLTITADGGGSNGAAQLWKVELQKARRRDRPGDHGLPLPAGTSKWNKIEHRMFSFISPTGAEAAR